MGTNSSQPSGRASASHASAKPPLRSQSGSQAPLPTAAFRTSTSQLQATTQPPLVVRSQSTTRAQPLVVQPQPTAQTPPQVVQPQPTARAPPQVVHPQSTARAPLLVVHPQTTTRPPPLFVHPQTTTRPPPLVVQPQPTARAPPQVVQPQPTTRPPPLLVHPQTTTRTPPLDVQPQSSSRAPPRTMQPSSASAGTAKPSLLEQARAAQQRHNDALVNSAASRAAACKLDAVQGGGNIYPSLENMTENKVGDGGERPQGDYWNRRVFAAEHSNDGTHNAGRDFLMEHSRGEGGNRGGQRGRSHGDKRGARTGNQGRARKNPEADSGASDQGQGDKRNNRRDNGRGKGGRGRWNHFQGDGRNNRGENRRGRVEGDGEHVNQFQGNRRNNRGENGRGRDGEGGHVNQYQGNRRNNRGENGTGRDEGEREHVNQFQGNRRNNRGENGRERAQADRKQANEFQGDKHHGGGSEQGGSKSNGNYAQRPAWELRPIGYQKLEEWSQIEDATDLVTLVANTRNGFYMLMEADDQTLTFDKIGLVVKVLAKVCTASFDASKKEILTNTCKCSKFVHKLTVHMTLFMTEKQVKRRAAIPSFFQNLLAFCETVMHLLPQTACDTLAVTLTIMGGAMTNAALGGIKLDPKLIEKVTRLTEQLKYLTEDRDRKKQDAKKSSHRDLMHNQAPPDDYRQISIFPLPEDIIGGDRVFIRPNITQGAYHDVDHYLDVQFRLLREDFVAPLRDGIKSLEEHSKKKVGNVRVYRKVKFESIHVTRDRPGLVVHFETRAKINWERSKRLMFGSLLCFTKDNFVNILFATVLDRNVEELKLGRIVVDISREAATEEHQFNVEYTMVESEVFFPPYQHVLAALQSMTPDNFPMSRYIVYVEAEAELPLYLDGPRDVMYNVDGLRVPVLRPADWPSPAALGLDESQDRAFRLALTQEFVVIQGPPGTGKTYLALKIARTLLANVGKLLEEKRDELMAEMLRYGDQVGENQALTQRRNNAELETRGLHKSPMLVVCFTNHALDQFLEGLIPATRNIIRVGGQSRSDVLKEYNLRERRFKVNFRTNLNRKHLSRELHQRMSKLLARIKGIESDMKSLNNEGIISLNSVAKVVDHQTLVASFWNDGVLSNDMLLDWLLEGSAEFNPLVPPAPPPARPPAGQPLLEVDEEDGAMENQAERRRGDEVWQREMDDELDLDRDVDEQVAVEFAVSFAMMRDQMTDIRLEIERAADDENRMHTLDQMHDQLALEMQYLNHWLCHPPTLAVVRADQRGANLWGLRPAERWAVYHQWVGQVRRRIVTELREVQATYCDQAKQQEEMREQDNLELMRDADVVGMTTTMAAKSQVLLQALKPRIVIVEEAAEAMESHIVVSLSAHCQHLILIGDHKQLRPTTAVYRLAQQYKLDISLFERMLNNGLHCEQLKVQHRMLPGIARLIVPAVYAELINHESVTQYEPIRGLDKSLFFLSHKNAELEIEESNTRQNKFEGDFVLALCRHILLQGYEASRVTILTTYSGQMFYLRKVRKNYPLLSEVQITIVDNFQGEENDIIILSLVRNNATNNIGFLSIENRVCVALSRAKHGMYILGNMDNLTASSKVWPMIKEALVEQNALGDALVLRCAVHPDQLTPMRRAEDFNQVSEGGCQRQCGTELTCGHTCKSMCHANDREHRNYHCMEDCIRVPPRCALEHICTKPCHADCNDCLTPVERLLPCGHSLVLACHVDVTSYKCLRTVVVANADCGHEYNKPCHKPAAEVKCPHPCVNRLDCGHTCTRRCHVNDDPDHVEHKCRMPCEKKNTGCTKAHQCKRLCWEECGLCIMEQRKKGPRCDHLHTVACSKPREDINCDRPCQRAITACGHPCGNKCNEPCGGCKEMAVKVIPECGHTVRMKCSEEPRRRLCKEKCARQLACGHLCERQCKVECSLRSECQAMVASRVAPVCGHQVNVPCSVNAQGLPPDSIELLSMCMAPCNTALQCGHPCTGSCGKCLQGRVHVGCSAKCDRTLVCGHACKEPCAEACMTCKEKCRMKCRHSKCNKRCGVPCTSCTMPCDWRCEHLACTQLCGQPCDRAPCYEPCPRRLPCRHPCIGFCGEPCPPLCRVCNEDEVTEVFFGDEDEPDSRFVYLEDCKHSLESSGLENWLTQANEEGKHAVVKMPLCPKCNTEISRTLRFSNIVKTAFRDVRTIKEKMFGTMQTIEQRRKNVSNELKEVAEKAGVDIQYELKTIGPNKKPISCERILKFGSGFTTPMEQLFTTLFARLQPMVDQRRNILSLSEVESLGVQVALFAQLCSTYTSRGFVPKKLTEQMHLLIGIIHERKRFSPQEVEDLNLEVLRFRRLKQFTQLNPKPTDPVYDELRRIVTSIRKYSAALDKNVEVLVKKLGDLTEQETFKQVVAAMGMMKGHWFKCPNDHYYVIGECGGAMETGKCPDCGEAVGGGRHRLLGTNRIATEIDGARMGSYDAAVAANQRFFN